MNMWPQMWLLCLFAPAALLIAFGLGALAIALCRVAGRAVADVEINEESL